MPTRAVERDDAQNVTLRLKGTTLRRARILAAREGTSMSRLLARAIEEMVREDEAYEAAKRAALAELEHGYPLGGRVPGTREELHDRARLR